MKKLITLFMLVVLAGCGFRPMFTGQDTDIYVPPIRGINGIELRNKLNAQFGGQRQSDAKYTLNVTLDEPSTLYKGLSLSGAATWREISIRASYTITHNGKKIASGNETASESYTISGYLVAANAAYNNAVKNTIQVLATKIGTRAIAATSKYESDSKSKK